jgi:phenylacetate-coenzyme A ligase PaaK-like adenylate-forming protein
LGAKDDLTVVATYGFTEAKMAWGECPFRPGETPTGYHLYPDMGIIEIIDPETGEVQPDDTGGEIVYTAVDARGSVVLRYRTGDCIDGGLTYAPCPGCGRTAPRLVGNISRRSEVRELHLDKIKGTLVDFNALEHLLDGEDSVGSWQLELRKLNDDPLDVDELILHVESNNATKKEELGRTLSARMVEATELRPNEVHFHDAATMRKRHGVGVEIKEKRLVDNRPKEGVDTPPRESDKEKAFIYRPGGEGNG